MREAILQGEDRHHGTLPEGPGVRRGGGGPGGARQRGRSLAGTVRHANGMTIGTASPLGDVPGWAEPFVRLVGFRRRRKVRSSKLPNRPGRDPGIRRDR